uniref:Uncharacterized protein n=1 Tax=Akashiwo sanguinea TaxID=143672 RepID=A0A7S2QWZ8_9DINO|mmetsp:Transcript_1409/g.863  ORF Transcript_1409/g.863 Transcript_1409/m.863 type:complete len:103 (+) Transcript_1409:111-419(+)
MQIPRSMTIQLYCPCSLSSTKPETCSLKMLGRPPYQPSSSTAGQASVTLSNQTRNGAICSTVHATHWFHASQALGSTITRRLLKRMLEPKWLRTLSQNGYGP